MRIKLATNTPLPKYTCWFGISEKQEKQTVHHLRKKIANDLKLESEPSNLQLLIDGFSLLPQTIIKDLVRDGDLITVKTQSAVKNKSKKRKISSSEEKHDKEITLPVKKKSKKSTEKDTKTKELKKKPASSKEKPEEKTEKKQRTKEKAEKKQRTSLTTAEKTEKKQPTPIATTLETEEEPSKTRSLPFEGTSKTKARNMRRKLLKQQRAIAVTPSNEPDIPASIVIEKEIAIPTKPNEAVIENLSIMEEPLQLIKKNKNKKKNHLKQADQRSHVHYATEEEEKVTNNNPTTVNKKNAHGRAFVTFVEADAKYKPKNNTGYTPREYPINRVPTLFYAQDQPVEKEEVVVVEETVKPFIEPVVEVEQVQEEEAPINYEETYAAVSFTDNIPVNSKLAIKTLELTAAYTPEISDWKQVYLKNLNEADNTVTVEYLPGFGKASTKGGKFDFKKKRSYDDWYYNEEQNEEEEEEEEEKEVTISCNDIFAMRLMK